MQGYGVRTKTEQKLGARTMAGYGIGDFGFNLYWTGLSIYLLYYYTDVLGIDPLTAGLIFGVSIFWDAITDPIMGMIATRTQTKWGKFRPYILFGAPLMGISFVMMFAAPVFFPAAVVLSSAIAHLVFRTMFTLVSIPYSSLSAVLTQDSDTRTRLAGVRMIGAVAGALFATALMPSLAAEFGEGDLKHGWVMVGVLFACVATVLMVVVFLSTKEDTAAYSARARVTLADSLRFVLSNQALWIVFGAVALGSMGNSIGGKSVVYFFKYNLNAEAQTGALLGLQALGAVLSIPLWVWLAGRTSKRAAWMLGSVLLGCLQTGLYFFAPSDASQIAPAFFVMGVCLGAFAVMFWSMVPDTVEYGQWKSGVRDEGMAFSLSTFSQKSGVALGVGVLGFWLSTIGYMPDAVQTEISLNGLRAGAFGFPALCSFLVAGVIWFYPIDRAKHAEMLANIAAEQAQDIPAN